MGQIVKFVELVHDTAFYLSNNGMKRTDGIVTLYGQA